MSNEYNEYDDIKHVGNCPERRNIWNPAEKVYAERWEKENIRVPGLNGGRGYLELLLNECPYTDHGLYRPVSEITQRDAYVAATVIQWLGTNIGRCLIEECKRKAKEIEPECRIAQQVSMRLTKGITHY